MQQDGRPVALSQQSHLMGQVFHHGRGAHGVHALPRLVSQEGPIHPPEPGLVEHPRGRRRQVVERHRLGEEVLRPRLHGFNRRLDIARSRQQHDQRVEFAQALQDLHPVHSGQVEIQDHHVRAEMLVRRQARLTRQFTRHLVADLFQVLTDGP